MKKTIEQKIRIMDIRARNRMQYLYYLAHLHKGVVLDCGNHTESCLGFTSLHGDVGDYGIINGLWKTEIYELSNWIIDNELNNDNEKKNKFIDYII